MNLTQITTIALLLLLLYFLVGFLLNDAAKNNHWLASMGFTQEGEMVLIQAQQKQKYKKTYYNVTLKGKGDVPDLIIKNTSKSPFYSSYRLFKRLENYPKRQILKVRWKPKAFLHSEPIIVSIEGKRGFGRFNPISLIVAFMFFGGISFFIVFILYLAFRRPN